MILGVEVSQHMPLLIPMPYQTGNEMDNHSFSVQEVQMTRNWVNYPNILFLKLYHELINGNKFTPTLYLVKVLKTLFYKTSDESVPDLT